MSTTTTTTTTIPEGLMFPNEYVHAEEFKARVIKIYEDDGIFEVEPKGSDTDETIIKAIFDTLNYDDEQVGIYAQENEELQEMNESMKKTLQDKFNEIEALKAELELQKKISFWRMCEAYNGFHKNTDLRSSEWIVEMNAMIEDRFEEGLGSVEDLQAGYLDWVGGGETEEEE